MVGGKGGVRGVTGGQPELQISNCRQRKLLQICGGNGARGNAKCELDFVAKIVAIDDLYWLTSNGCHNYSPEDTGEIQVD